MKNQIWLGLSALALAAWIPVAVAQVQSQSKTLRFKDFQNLIVQSNANSVETALPVIAAMYPAHMKFHTLMYGSLSIQQSTFEEPRAIVFGPDASFIFTFNGNNNMFGGHSFESMQYSKKTHSFAFREIAFKYPGFDLSDLSLDPSEVAFENQNVVISKANPAKCLACHGDNASPIWATYFMWPGAYGSDDDMLGMSFVRPWNGNSRGFFEMTNRPSSQGRLVSFKPGMPDTELQGLVRYASAKSTHPRYKYLPMRITETAVLKYAQGTPFEQLNFSEQADAERAQLNVKDAEWPTRPNDFLLTNLTIWNQDRLIARLDQAGLRNAFADLPWKNLYNGVAQFTSERVILSPLKSDAVIPVLAANIRSVITNFKFNGPTPTQQQVEATLRKNFLDEILMQRERLNLQDSLVGKGSLQYQPYINQDADGHLNPEIETPRFDEMSGPVEFYATLTGVRQLTQMDLASLQMETDNIILNTAVALMLADRGIDLHQYSLTMRQNSISFHTGGLDRVFSELGVRFL